MRIFVINLLCIYLFACELEKGMSVEDQSDIVGKWQLSEMISGWTAEVTPASQLDYNQYFIFNSDGTFLKNRSNGQSASGTYSIKELTSETYVEVTFNKPNSELLESCSSKEYLRLTDDHKLNGGSLPCDGPGLNYTKVWRSDVDE